MKLKKIKEKKESVKRELRAIEDCPNAPCRTRHDQLNGFLEAIEWFENNS